MRKIFPIIILSLMLLSGCSLDFGSGNDKTGTPEKDNTGTGLNVDFSINKELIENGRLIYHIKLKNTGSEIIELTKDNLKLYTSEKYKNNYYIEQESIYAFYDKLFKNGNNIKFHQDMEIEEEGVLKIQENILNHPNLNSFNIVLKIEYPYKTKFVSNLELIKQYNLFKISKGGNLQQASPIQLNKVELLPDVEDNNYNLKLEIYNKGDKGNSNSLISNGIRIKNFDIEFASKRLDCEKLKTQENIDDNWIVYKDSPLILECPTTIDKDDNFITQLRGDFEYRHTIKESSSITLK